MWAPYLQRRWKTCVTHTVEQCSLLTFLNVLLNQRMHASWTWNIFFDLFLYFDPHHYAIQYPLCCICSCIALALFTMKVLAHLFQVDRLHHSFSFPPMFLHSLRRSVSWRDQSRDNHITASLLPSPFFSLQLFQLTFIVSLGMPTHIYPLFQKQLSDDQNVAWCWFLWKCTIAKSAFLFTWNHFGSALIFYEMSMSRYESLTSLTIVYLILA